MRAAKTIQRRSAVARGLRRVKLITVFTMGIAPSLTAAAVIEHGKINVVQNNGDNTAASVTATTSGATPGFGLASGSNRGDFNLSQALVPANGTVITSVRQNGRNNFAAGDPEDVVRYGTSAIAASGSAFFIPVFGAYATSPEFNINLGAAYFPHSQYLSGQAYNTANNGEFTSFVGNSQIVLGTHLVDEATPVGTSTLRLGDFTVPTKNGPVAATSANGILLVTAAKNENNYGMSRPNGDGSFTVIVHDNQANATSYENDPVAFAYVPLNDPEMIAVGRIAGDGSTQIGSGQFTVTRTADAGSYLLSILGHDDTTGTLLLSAEGGGNLNVDNIVSYEWDAAQAAWLIQTRDLPGTGLQTPDATEAVFSFAFVPVPEPTMLGLAVPAGLMLLRRSRLRRKPTLRC